ncbi:diaminopimelate decarboxylase [Halorubrum amylolyticum]|uniref:diaminopimelate decarboxylase n=1 Tax=Halorubrum amylolyticum TaxID=2508724 RepID=UPI001008B505|nr:diaminopimelate decarboxylase [Halorubrum amylolyticum]
MSETEPVGENPVARRVSDWNADRLADLAAEYGTPLYVQDIDRVRENCERLRDAFPDADVRYAVKAHTGRVVLEAVREAGLDAECASAGEVDRALAAGFGGDRLHYTAVNPPARDLDYVVGVAEAEPDLTVTVGAVDTLDRLAERGYDGRVCVRVNPGVGAGHHEKVRTGGAAKFGVPYDRAAEATRNAAERFDVVGIHAHAGSGIDPDQLDSHRELVARMGELARELAAPGESAAGDAAPLDLEYVDVGGGFGVPYREDAPALDLPAVAEATREAVAPLPAGVDLAIEPGRYVVADAGVLLARVNTVKPTPDERVVGVDAGMTDLLRPAMYDAYHPIRNLGGGRESGGRDAPTPGDRSATPVTVAGPICETGDTLCMDRALADPARGDLLAVGIAGAYGYEMANQYNSRPRPAEVAVDDGTAAVVRRRETLGDLTTVERDANRNRTDRTDRTDRTGTDR